MHAHKIHALCDACRRVYILRRDLFKPSQFPCPSTCGSLPKILGRKKLGDGWVMEMMSKTHNFSSTLFLFSPKWLLSRLSSSPGKNHSRHTKASIFIAQY